MAWRPSQHGFTLSCVLWNLFSDPRGILVRKITWLPELSLLYKMDQGLERHKGINMFTYFPG